MAGQSVLEALGDATRRLADAGSDTPRLDAELLMAEALGVTRAELYSDGRRPIPAEDAARVEPLLRRREDREPVAYILGRKGFRRIELQVDGRVLVPRPDTELLVEVALGLRFGARVHDVGTGSGAVALALKDERPDLRVSASDSSQHAVDVARANAERLGLDVPVQLATGLPPGDYDMVLANMPYVASYEIAALEPEIRRHEPRNALVAEEDGLALIRELIDSAPSGTLLALEHSEPQAAAVRAMLDQAETARDLAGRERVTIGRAP